MPRAAVVLLGILLFGLAALSRAAQAQSLPEQPGDRFSYNAVGDGVLRLDLRTGEVSLCARSQAGWTCRVMADERAALEAEIARLQADTAILKKALADNGLPLPGGQATGAPLPYSARPGEPTDRAIERRNDTEHDRIMMNVKKAWRRLLELMVSLKRDPQK